MKNLSRLLLSAILALAACSPLVYGKLDEPSVAVTQNIPGTVPGSPTRLVVPANLFPAIPFDIGEVTVDQSSKDSSIKLNGATVTIVTGTGADFTGIEKLQIDLTRPGATQPDTIARYDKAAGIGSLTNNNKSITLVPTSDIELISYLAGASGKQLSVGVSGTGTPPTVAWTGEVTLDFHIIAQKNVI